MEEGSEIVRVREGKRESEGRREITKEVFFLLMKTAAGLHPTFSSLEGKSTHYQSTLL